MSWSLQVQNGDLVLNGAQFGTVTGSDKLVQDLRCALLEPMGTDDMHPSYGSLLDGGVMPNGQVVPSVIGMSDINQVATTVEAEIQRLSRAYQTQQLARAKDDQINFNRVSLSPAEVLLSVTNIDMTQNADTLVVTVTLETGQGQSLSVVIPLLTNS